MPVKVVYLPLPRVPEDLIGLCCLFEFLFGLFVSWVAIRMIVKGHPPICLFYFIFGGVTGNPQECIIIFFSHISQQRKPDSTLNIITIDTIFNIWFNTSL